MAEAVRGAWASLWNPRAVSYRKRVGLDTTENGIAVVVQRMIDAERSGVLFTANPLDHRRDRRLLSASWGPGEAVEPFTPAGLDWWRAIVGGFAHAATGRPERDLPWPKKSAGRLLADITEPLRKPGRWPQPAEAASDKDPITGQALLAFRKREGARIIGRKGGIGFWWRLGPLFAGLQVLGETDAKAA